MIDRAFFTAGREVLDRSLYAGPPRKLTIGQTYQSGIPNNSPQRTITFTNVPQWPILVLGGYDSPAGVWDVQQSLGYEWLPGPSSGGNGSGAGSSSLWFGKRTSSSPSKTYNAQGGAGGGTGFEEIAALEMPGLRGEVLWQGQAIGTSTTLVTPQPKRGIYVPGCLFVVLGRWRSGGASGFSVSMSNGQTPFLTLMGNITIAYLYRYLPGSRPVATVVYARSVFASLQAVVIR